jgi:hypothetical protein
MSARSLNIEIDLKKGSSLDDLHKLNKKMYEAKTGGKDMTHQMEIAERQMMHFANTTGVTNSQMEHMIATARKDIHLEKEMKAAAKAAGLTEDELKLINVQLRHMKTNGSEANDKMTMMKKIVGSMAALGVGAMLFGGAKASLETFGKFEKYEKVLTTTLQSAKKAALAMADIEKFAQSTPFSVDALTDSYIKLTNRGMQPTMIEMQRYGDIAASQGKSFDQFSEALMDATTGEFERLKEFGMQGSKMGNQVSLSFKGVQKTVANTPEAIKGALLAFGEMKGVTGMMSEMMDTYEGKMSNLGDEFDQIKKEAGGFLYGVLKPILNAFTDGEKGVNRLKWALLFLGSVALASLITYYQLYTIASIKAAIGTALAWAPVLVPILIITGALIGLFLLMEDIYGWVTGTKNSVFGAWFGDFDTIWPRIKAWFASAGQWLKDTAMKYGKYIIMALFPITALYFFRNEIISFFKGIGSAISGVFSDIWESISRGFSSLVSKIPLINKFVGTTAVNTPAQQIEHRAKGGPVYAGIPFVGVEEGAEVFTPKRDGYVTPNHKLGGKSSNINITISIDARGASSSDAKSIAQKAKDAIVSAIPAIRAQLGLEDSFA